MRILEGYVLNKFYGGLLVYILLVLCAWAMFWRTSVSFFWVTVVVVFMVWYLPALLLTFQLSDDLPIVVRFILYLSVVLACTGIVSYLLGHIGLAVKFQAIFIVPLTYVVIGAIWLRKKRAPRAPPE
jgi:hypothetical protein